MECLELKTGKVKFSERVRGRGAKQESWSSMLLVGDRIFIPNQSGETIVLRARPKFELIRINPLDGTLTNCEPTNICGASELGNKTKNEPGNCG